MRRAIRLLWCRQFHAWRGWQMTPELAAEQRSPVERRPDGGVRVHGVQTGSFERRTCRFCRDHDDEMPRHVRWWGGR